MKKIMLFATFVAMSLAVAMPVNAQSRKDKKAAKKEAWEMRQQFIKDSTERANKAKLDAMEREERAKEEAAAKAKANQEQKAKEEATAKAKAEKLVQKRTVSKNPCQIYDDADWFTATGSMLFKEEEEDLTPMALLSSVQQQLYQKLSGKYQSVTSDYFDMMHTENVNYKRQHIERAGLKVVEQMVNETYETCREITDYPNEKGEYTMYMSIKISKKVVEEKIIEEINNEKETQIRLNEEKFRQSFDKVFNEKE
jgi:hypothetical protein